MYLQKHMRCAVQASSRMFAIVFAVACMNASVATTAIAQGYSVKFSRASALVANKRDSTDDNLSRWRFDQCLGGLTYGAPLKLAVAWAGGLRKELASGQDVCAFVSPKIGLGGARLSAGVARTFG